MKISEDKSDDNDDLTELAAMLKLVSGETIICLVIADTEKNLIVKDPFVINAVSEKTEDGIKTSTYYANWFLGSMLRIHMIRKEHIISATIPNPVVGNDYTQLVDSIDNKSSQTPNPVNKHKDGYNWDGYNPGDDVSRN